MSEVKWIKITTSIFDDEAIKIIEQMPDGDAIIVIWFKLLIQAGVTNDSGLVYFKNNIPFTDETLSIVFNRPVNTIRLALTTFEKFGMIEITDNETILIRNWEKHQSTEKLELIKEQTRKRVKKYREKQKISQCNVTPALHVTQCNAVDIDKDIDIDKELIKKEINKEKKDFFCNLDFQKCFELYEKHCTDLLPLGYAKRNKEVLNLLSEFLEEIEYNFEYFENLCVKANELKIIVTTKIDFKMMIKNHNGIMQGKYIKEVNEPDLLSMFDFD